MTKKTVKKTAAPQNDKACTAAKTSGKKPVRIRKPLTPEQRARKNAKDRERRRRLRLARRQQKTSGATCGASCGKGGACPSVQKAKAARPASRPACGTACGTTCGTTYTVVPADAVFDLALALVRSLFCARPAVSVTPQVPVFGIACHVKGSPSGSELVRQIETLLGGKLPRG